MSKRSRGRGKETAIATYSNGKTEATASTGKAPQSSSDKHGVLKYDPNRRAWIDKQTGEMVVSNATTQASPATAKWKSRWSEPDIEAIALPDGVPTLAEALESVMAAYSFPDLAIVCGVEEVVFDKVATRIQHHPQDSPHWFVDNGGDILAVAHLDSVQSERWCLEATSKGGDACVCSPVLDDRLGAYTIFCLLPRLGIKVDLLFCTDEERGASTAMDFHSEKQYKWMVEFDRAGADCVHYQYEDKDWNGRMAGAGWDVQRGMFSDISSLGHLGCMGMNVGVGYANYHSRDAYAHLPTYFTSIAKFVRFHAAYKDTAFPYTEAVASTSHGSGSYSGRYDTWRGSGVGNALLTEYGDYDLAEQHKDEYVLASDCLCTGTYECNSCRQDMLDTYPSLTAWYRMGNGQFRHYDKTTRVATISNVIPDNGLEEPGRFTKGKGWHFKSNEELKEYPALEVVYLPDPVLTPAQEMERWRKEQAALNEEEEDAQAARVEMDFASEYTKSDFFAFCDRNNLDAFSEDAAEYYQEYMNLYRD
jgi:hypothetical protein